MPVTGGGDTRPWPVSVRDRMVVAASVSPCPPLLCQVWGAGTLRARAAPRACDRGTARGGALLAAALRPRRVGPCPPVAPPEQV